MNTYTRSDPHRSTKAGRPASGCTRRPDCGCLGVNLMVKLYCMRASWQPLTIRVQGIALRAHTETRLLGARIRMHPAT